VRNLAPSDRVRNHARVTNHPQICRAIQSRTLLEFDYDELHRIVQPYVHGFTREHVEGLRAIQVGGASRSGGLGFGKLWHVGKMMRIRNTDEKFLPTDPHYNPDDVALVMIHCAI